MRLLRFGCALFLLVVGFAVVADAQDQKTFPTDDEINLLLTQSERALQQYKSVIAQEQTEIGKRYAEDEDAAKDRQLVSKLEYALKTLKTHPQGFNRPAGFGLVLWLDDAVRNTLLLATRASNDSTLKLVAGDTKKAISLTNLSRTCMDASTLLYTVSENASSLYERYVKGEEQLAPEAVETAQKCVDVLKKKNHADKTVVATVNWYFNLPWVCDRRKSLSGFDGVRSGTR